MTNMWKHRLILLTAMLIPGGVAAEEIFGHVVGVADGDTLTVLVNSHEQLKVRLAEIDAPEKAQPFGRRSKQSLSDLCFGKNAMLEKTDIDRYGRTVAKVYCVGVYANAEQIRVGLAWAYRKYLHDQSLLALENEARSGRLGLWSENNPVPPWDYRKTKRQGTNSHKQLGDRLGH